MLPSRAPASWLPVAEGKAWLPDGARKDAGKVDPVGKGAYPVTGVATRVAAQT
jgi:hypothetical protein